jgi:ABC-2 type transport system permease protein
MSTANAEVATETPDPAGTADAASVGSLSGRPSLIRHWLRLFRSELRIVYLRPRNLAVLALLAAAPIFLGIVLRINAPAPGSGGPSGAGQFIGQVTENGIFLSLLAIFVLLTLVLPLAVAVVAGDSVAGEAGLGTLRTLLTVPVGRVRLVLTKYLMIVVFCFTACLIVAGVGLLMGALLFPIGPVTLLSGETVPLVNALGRLALIVLYVTVGLSALGAVGIALSTLTQHAIAVMAAILVIAMVSEILDAISQVNVIHPYLPTHYWLSFDALLRTPITWTPIWHGLGSFAAYIVIFGGLAVARIRQADVTC